MPLWLHQFLKLLPAVLGMCTNISAASGKYRLTWYLLGPDCYGFEFVRSHSKITCHYLDPLTVGFFEHEFVHGLLLWSLFFYL